jgi:hypothetical protein
MLANPLYFIALALAAAVGVSAQTANACILSCVQTGLANSTCTSLCVVMLDYLPSISLTLLTSAAPTSVVSARVQASKKLRSGASLQTAPLLTSRLPFNFNKKNAAVCIFPPTPSVTLFY